MFRTRAVRWISPAAVFVLAAGATFTAVLVRELPPQAQETAQSELTASAPASDLGLRVDSDGDRLSLSWNRRNPLVLSATGGSLLIEDGSQHREIHLDSSQIADGSVSYRPISSDVTFRLKVIGKEQSATGSMRVLDGVSAPSPKATAALGVIRPKVTSALAQEDFLSKTSVSEFSTGSR
ncbi:MAG TPA: hypothetical protein VLI55_16345 [Bryobacteraceae bacterium]|nr:hypothetical protein [Bryobacteraceae bacterium]